MIAEILFNSQEQLIQMIWMWLALLGLFFYIQIKKTYEGAGFIFSYIVLFSLAHLFGAVIHAVSPFPRPEFIYVVLGFRESLWGLGAFCVGALLPAFRRSILENNQSKQVEIKLSKKEILLLISTGIGFVALDRFLGSIPSVGAAVRSGKTFLLIGILLGAWQAILTQKRMRVLVWMMCLGLYPVIGLLGSGFLSYATITMVISFSFLMIFYKPRWHVVGLAIPFIYLAISFFVAYMRERDEIREKVWKGASLEERVGKVKAVFQRFEWFDQHNDAHLSPIEGRLNQNIFVGKTVYRIENGSLVPLGGVTLWWGFCSMVPRILWPGKPMTAGSMGIMSYLIGEYLAVGTSFGLGQVLEAYANFKRVGVLVCMFLLGWLIAELDLRCGKALRKGDWRTFALFFTVTVPLICPEWSSIELFSGTAAAIVMAWTLRKTILKKFNNEKTEKMDAFEKEKKSIQQTNETQVSRRPIRFEYKKTKPS